MSWKRGVSAASGSVCLLFSSTLVFLLCSWITDKRNQCPLNWAHPCWGRRPRNRNDSTHLPLVLRRMMPMDLHSFTSLLDLAPNTKTGEGSPLGYHLHKTCALGSVRKRQAQLFSCATCAWFWGLSAFPQHRQRGQALLVKKTIAINNSNTGVKCLKELVKLHFLIDLQVFLLTLSSLEKYILLLADKLKMQFISLRKNPNNTKQIKMPSGSFLIDCCYKDSFPFFSPLFWSLDLSYFSCRQQSQATFNAVSPNVSNIIVFPWEKSTPFKSEKNWGFYCLNTHTHNLTITLTTTDAPCVRCLWERLFPALPTS